MFNVINTNRSSNTSTNSDSHARSRSILAAIAVAVPLAIVAVVALAGGLNSTNQVTSPEAKGRQLLTQVLNAHGGLDRFRSFGTFQYHTDALPYSAAAPLEFDHTADLFKRRHHMKGSSAKGEFVTASNDSLGWTTNQEALGIPARWVNHGNSYFAMMPFVFADEGTSVRSVGTRVFNGETFDAIAVRFDRGVGDTAEDDYILYIDRDTHRLRLIDFSVTYGPMRGDTPIDQLPRRSLEFVEWQDADGLLVPKALRYAAWERTADGGKQKEEGARYHLTKTKFTAARPDATLFDAPAGVTIDRAGSMAAKH